MSQGSTKAPPTFLERWTYYKDLAIILTQKDLKVRYANSYLGYFWSLALPLALALTFYYVFTVLMNLRIVPDYALFLVAGLFPWQAFQNSITGGGQVFLGNSFLLKRVKFPRQFLVLSLLLNEVFHFIMSIPVLIFFLLFYGKLSPKIVIWVLYIPLNLLPMMLLAFGLSLIIACANVFFRDLDKLVLVLTTIWFYFTPLFYSVKMVPARFQSMVLLNPMTLIINNWRNIFMQYSINWMYWAISMMLGLLVSGFGYYAYVKLNPRLSEAV